MMDVNNTTSTSDTAKFLDEVNHMLWQILPPVFLIFGTFGNVMVVVVMRGMRASQSTACLSVYFTALAVSDQFLLTIAVVWFGVEAVFSWPSSFFKFDLLCTVPYFVFYLCSWMSAWFLVAMTYQRVTSVVTPHRVGVLCTVRRGKIIVAAILVITIGINFHILFTFAYQHDYKVCSYQQKYVDFIYVFTWLDLFCASLIPFVLLIGGNSVLVWQVIQSISFSRKMRRTANDETTSGSRVYPMTMTLILTSAVFLILTLPVCIFHTYRRTLDLDIVDDDFRAILDFAETICLFLWNGASSSNFYLYFLSGSKFREETKRYLCRDNKHSQRKMAAS
ncbi:hypothetical protein ACOMHN_024205 [Nucella lapillus]